MLERTPVGTRDVPGEKKGVTFSDKPNSSPQALRPKVIAHSFWPFLMNLTRAALETLTHSSARAFSRVTQTCQKKHESFQSLGVVLKESFLEFQERPIFSIKIWIKFLKNYQCLHAVVGHYLGALPLAQWMS